VSTESVEAEFRVKGNSLENGFARIVFSIDEVSLRTQGELPSVDSNDPLAAFTISVVVRARRGGNDTVA